MKNSNPEKIQGIFAEKIKLLRVAKGFAKNGVPGVSDSTIQKYENQNHPPTAEMISKLAIAYGYNSPEQLEDLKRLASEQQSKLAQSSESAQSPLAGVSRVSTGTSRFDAFRELTLKAQKRVLIMGIGMTNITIYARSKLEKLANKVPIDFLMINPDVLESEPEFAKKLEGFLDYPGFAIHTRLAFNILRDFCLNWNKGKNKKRMRFRVYDTIPTMSMVMIDPKTENGEIELEFFVYQGGEFRVRLSVKKTKNKDDLFFLVNERIDKLWKHSRRIV